MNLVRVLSTTAVLSLALAGCGQEVIDEQDLEQEAKRVITAQAGEEPKSIDCPGDLDAKKGEKMTCTLVAQDDSKVDAVVTVDSAEGDDARFTVELKPPS